MKSNKYTKYLGTIFFSFNQTQLPSNREAKIKQEKASISLSYSWSSVIIYRSNNQKWNYQFPPEKSVLSHFWYISHLTMVIWGEKQINLFCSSESFLFTSFNFLHSILSPSSGWGIFTYTHRESNIYSSLRQIYDVATHWNTDS